MYSKLDGLEMNHCLSENIDVVKAENGILRRKLESKTDGLKILSKEVETLRNELNQMKVLNEHLMNPKSSEMLNDAETMQLRNNKDKGFSTSSARERNRMELYKQLRKKNYTLVIERENLKQQLVDAKTDISILKENLQKAGKAIRRRSSENETGNKNSSDNKRESREILIAKMEEIQLKHNSLKHDLQRLLDEKEDIVREKEEMNLKIHRMSFQLKQLVAHDKLDLLDLDHIISENKYLTERLNRLQDEKDLANQMGRRYKEALEASKRIHCSKDVKKDYLQSLLKGLTFPVPQPVDLDTSGGLSELCVSLLETLSDRQMQIKHQRAANKELAERVERLQDKLTSVDGGEILVFPSQVIMKDYKPDASGEDVDVPVDELREKYARKLERKSQKSDGAFSKCEDDAVEELQVDEVERPVTPNYEDLNKRFQDLLHVLNSRNNSEVNEDEDDDNVFEENAPPDSVYLSLTKPPDILDFSRRSIPDLELEEVNITVDGLEIVNSGSGSDDDLPDHIKDMVNKAIKEIQ